MSGLFISYSSKDAAAAEEILAGLEAAGLQCWIAPRDIPPGAEWPGPIIDAIRGALAFLQILSENANASPQMKREIELASNARIPIIPVRLANVAPSANLQFFLGHTPLFDAYPPPLKDHMPRLAGEIAAKLARPRG